MEQFKIEDIQTVTLNRVPAKLFKAFELNDDCYVFIGQFRAPANVSDANLKRYIVTEDDSEM